MATHVKVEKNKLLTYTQTYTYINHINLFICHFYWFLLLYLFAQYAWVCVAVGVGGCVAVDTCVPDNVAKCSLGFVRHSDGSCKKNVEKKVENITIAVWLSLCLFYSLFYLFILFILMSCVGEQLHFHKTPDILNNNKSEIYIRV